MVCDRLGASFVEAAADVSTDTAIALMAGYFGGVVAGRTVGSRLSHRYDPTLLFAVALGVAATGFAVLWPSSAALQAVIGLTLLGIGLGNLFPMGLSVALAVAPGQSSLASGRAVMVTSAVLLAPATVGALADATSLKLAIGVVPTMLVLAATGLALVRRSRTPGRPRPTPGPRPA